MSDKPWRNVIAVDELEKDWVTRVEVGRKTIAVYDTPTGLYASLALCTHGGADLCDGYFDDHVIECLLHQGAFDVRDGRPIAAPATRAMRMLELRVREGQVQMRI